MNHSAAGPQPKTLPLMTLMNADFIGPANSEGKASMRYNRVQILENTSDIKKSSQKSKKLIITKGRKGREGSDNISSISQAQLMQGNRMKLLWPEFEEIKEIYHVQHI